MAILAAALGGLGIIFWIAANWGAFSRVGHFALLEGVADGWVLAALAGMAFWSGITFLDGASIDPASGGFSADTYRPYGPMAQAISLLLAGGATAWLAGHWRSLRQPWCALASLAMLGLAWMMPSLGAVLLALAVCATQGRRRLAVAAGIAAAWIIGAFYYQLAYPLATKALIMAGAGAWFGAVAWMALRVGSIPPSAAPAPKATHGGRPGIAVCALAVLAVANASIWQKETIIAQGTPVFIELAPVDPRSLMQGDYMRLAFRLPEANIDGFLPAGGAGRPRVIGKRDARGVVTLERLDDGSALAAGMIAIGLTHAHRGWTVVTDAWYFREGDATRWARAKYGEFRVAPDGRALLVGMRGPDLEPLLTP